MKVYQVMLAILFVSTMSLLWRSSSLSDRLDQAESDRWWCQRNLDLLENNNRDMVIELWRAHSEIDSLKAVIYQSRWERMGADTLALKNKSLLDQIIDQIWNDSTLLREYRIDLHQSGMDSTRYLHQFNGAECY